MRNEEIKTIREWLNELPDGVRKKAMANIRERPHPFSARRGGMERECSRSFALATAFAWSATPEGFAYWDKINNDWLHGSVPAPSVFDNIRDWGVEKGLTGPNGKATVAGQMDKLGEEFEELEDAVCYWIIAKGGLEQVSDFSAGKSMLDQSIEDAKDAIGDMTVVLVLLAELLGLRYEECVEAAYNEIKGRTGRMVNGVFAKEVVS